MFVKRKEREDFLTISLTIFKTAKAFHLAKACGCIASINLSQMTRIVQN